MFETGLGRCRRGRGVAIRQQADILGPLAQQQIDRRQYSKDQNAHRGAGGTPAGLLDHELHPRQQGHRADADAGKGEPHGEAAAANEPVRQEQRLAGIAETHTPRPDQHADGEIEMPGLRRQRRQQQPATHQRDAELHHPARTEAIHHAADQRTDASGDHEAEGESARREATVPSELADDRRKEQRERSPRIDADRHGDEGHHNDQPAVEEGKTYHRVSIFLPPWRGLSCQHHAGTRSFGGQGRRVQRSALTAPTGILPAIICLDLPHRFQRLAFDRRRRQSADMRGRDDVRQPGQLRRRHLVQRAADIHRGAGNAVLAQRRRERRLVDEIAARQVDEERIGAHPRQRRLPDQIFGFFIGDRETNDKVGSAEQIVERHMLDAGVADARKGIRDQDLHAQYLGDISEVPADAAIADDAEAAAGQLPAHDDGRLSPGMVVGRRA